MGAKGLYKRLTQSKKVQETVSLVLDSFSFLTIRIIFYSNANRRKLGKLYAK